jgi:hypothetical protein
MADDRQPVESVAGTEKSDPAESPNRRALRLVGETLGSLRFGQVILTIHDGVVVQFDKVEKHRLR